MRALLLTRMLDIDLRREPIPLELAYEDSSLVAALWLERSRRSEQALNTPLVSAELRAALAFHRKDFEAVIASAEEIELLGAPEESGALLASASRLDPHSSWLFETRIRWMIKHGQVGDALLLLQQRPIDELMALALDRRASERIAAGDVESASADLAAAIHLAPRDPWTRFRLAGLYQGTQRPERGIQLMSEGYAWRPTTPTLRTSIVSVRPG